MPIPASRGDGHIVVPHWSPATVWEMMLGAMSPKSMWCDMSEEKGGVGGGGGGTGGWRALPLVPPVVVMVTLLYQFSALPSIRALKLGAVSLKSILGFKPSLPPNTNVLECSLSILKTVKRRFTYSRCREIEM